MAVLRPLPGAYPHRLQGSSGVGTWGLGRGCFPGLRGL